ncbi:hypothetical protein DL98DRAFT_541662 [Cadophora sp. DSE1049]|nr:hypothetical protein DL98DRAFT_541662 [Cadophora sp. DSE1049]
MSHTTNSCDGQNPCARRAVLGRVTCYYEASVLVSKETMRAKIEELQTYRQISESVFASLVSEDRSDLILLQLRNGKRLEDIYKTLEGDAIPSQSSSDNSSALDGELSAQSSTSGGRISDRCSSTGEPRRHPLTYEGVLEQEQSDACSQANLAKGQASNTAKGRVSNFPARQSGYGQAIKTVSLTTIQALALMSIFEASRGRDKRSMFYSGQSIRMAVEMGLHRGTNDAKESEAEREVRHATIWGTFALDK